MKKLKLSEAKIFEISVVGPVHGDVVRWIVAYSATEGYDRCVMYF